MLEVMGKVKEKGKSIKATANRAQNYSCYYNSTRWWRPNSVSTFYTRKRKHIEITDRD